MILDLDIGNTRIKWRVTGLTSHEATHGFAVSDNWLVAIGNRPIERIRIANVAGDVIGREIADEARQSWGVEVEFAQTQKSQLGLTCGYEHPERLGVDRWLATLAAFRETGGDCCVVDCGSAITVDYVDKQGQHLGGLIAPGLRLMRKVLLEGTSEIRMDDPIEPVLQKVPLGTATDQAVTRGIQYMEVGLIELAYRRYQEASNLPGTLILTGGDAELVSGLLDCEHRVLPHLVLDGLALVLP